MNQTTVQKIRDRQASQSRQILEKLVESFENPQTLQNAVIKTFLDPIDVPQSRYSMLNRILLAIQGSYDARGNAAWRQIDRYPLDWSKKVFIVIPRMQKISGGKNDDGQKDEKTTVTAGFFYKGLYDVENTYGTSKNSKVAYVKNPPKTLPPLSDVAKKWGVEIEYRVCNNAWGSYNPAKNKIQLSTENAGTFFHELAHKAHEKIDGRLKMEQDPKQEAIAQLSAGVLSQMYDQKIDLETFEYIKGYAQDDPKKAMRLIHTVLYKTGQVLELILGATKPDKSTVAS